MRAKLTVTVAVHDGADGFTVTVQGRDAWALQQLHAAGGRGCTPIDHPGPRWSGYVHKLRKRGILIESREEQHGGPFAGRHVRYVLLSKLEVLAANDNSIREGN